MNGEIDIGMGKSARRVYDFADLSIVSSRRTRDAADVDTHWQIDAYEFEIPVMASPMDSVSSPDSVVALGRARQVLEAARRLHLAPGLTHQVGDQQGKQKTRPAEPVHASQQHACLGQYRDPTGNQDHTRAVAVVDLFCTCKIAFPGKPACQRCSKPAGQPACKIFR